VLGREDQGSQKEEEEEEEEEEEKQETGKGSERRDMHS
jgi:hypothetical protein